jgi:hypothetical protein
VEFFQTTGIFCKQAKEKIRAGGIFSSAGNSRNILDGNSTSKTGLLFGRILIKDFALFSNEVGVHCITFIHREV